MSETAAVHFPLRRGEQEAGNPLLGTVVDGKYLVQGVLGKGGMGTVFRATHQVSLVPVALKILNARFSALGDYRNYFLAEAQKAGRVVHEHAGRILDVGEAEDGTVYIAMEEVRGVTLYECLYGEVPVAPPTVVDILIQITQGLMAAHEAGLVHRDLSPRNVMVVIRSGDPFVKILDFGIAKGLPHTAAAGLDMGSSHEPALFANPPYSSPEHLEGKDVDDRGDLYSLGVIAYEALTQTLPVPAGTVKEMAAATIRGDLLPLRAPAGVPPRLVGLVSSLLARDPERRPRSAAEVLSTLELIREPGSRVIRDVAVLLLVVGIVVFGLSYYLDLDPTPTLTKRSLGGFEVVSPSAPPPAVVHYQSQQLEVITFDFDGFPASELVVEIDFQNGKNEPPYSLSGTVTADGKLLLDSRTNVQYRQVLNRVADEDGAALLVFYARGRVLGKARFVVDDVPPILTMSIRDENGQAIPSGGVLNEQSLISIGYQDTTSPSLLELSCVVDGQPHSIDLLDCYQEQDLKCWQVIGKLQGEMAVPLRQVRLQLVGQDLAGNTAPQSFVQVYALADFRIPAVRLPTELRALEDKIVGNASLVLELESAEEGLVVLVGGVPCPILDQSDAKITVQLVGGKIGGLSTGRDYAFELRDGAGNVRKFTAPVKFYSHAPEVILQDPVVTGVLHSLGKDRLVWSGAEGSVAFTCNSFYRPTSARLARVGGLKFEVDLKLSGSEYGQAVVHLPNRDAGYQDGRYELTVRLDPSDPEAKSQDHIWTLNRLGQGLKLRLPDPTGLRFFQDFSGDAAPLRLVGGVLQLRPGWQLTPLSDARLLYGTVYWSNRPGGAYQGLKLDAATSSGAALIPDRSEQLLHAGENTLGVQLNDVFGRPVEVTLGSKRAPAIEGLPAGAVRVMSFQYQSQGIEPPRDPLVLEYRRPTQVVLRTGYDFLASDREVVELTLKVSNPLPRKVRCTRIQPVAGGGSDLVFTIDYPTMADVVGKDREDPELRRGELEFEGQIEVVTPAFESGPIVTKIRCVRTSLPVGQLRRWFSNAGADLGQIEMVPVLRPIENSFPDPVSESLRQKGSFVRKQAIDVSNLRDFYLQSSELTRRQYAYVVEQFAKAKFANDPAVVVHLNGDPKGSERHEAGNMIPLTFTATSWAAAVAADPEASVTGISFYQAFALARMAGQVVAGDPLVFRLPFAVELEMAVLTGLPKGSLNGLGGQVLLDKILKDGDLVQTTVGKIRGVDFGVREWVLDLPWPTEPGARQIVAGVLRNHQEHRLQALDLSEQPNLSAGQKFDLRRIGVIRGRSLVDGQPVVDLLNPDTAVSAADKLPTGVPGVVKTMYLARSGTGLQGRPHRMLGQVGMRLVGGEEFLKRVRTR